ncbi:hypothetical protein CcCBS67573_g06712 [Chytriomyces confervae]|uniref:Ca3427-like PBP 2 domain-containing protein n=1 Tax=Chytriomyces confervae TaxID=246404 RepID=A0A507F3D2_9FUNG|nr:hypothetical protein HDU80_000633 [Chytriomyces hyalinus]TPX69898.1 hypothetical protein CcCBS67573_g06712 [Chytriomyces confervae]
MAPTVQPIQAFQNAASHASRLKSPALATMPSVAHPLTVGCVPEHFSIPFFHTKTSPSNPFKVTSCPSGTGQMIKMLQSGEIDICVGLTEGLVAGLAKDSEKAGFKIVGSLTRSSLTWSVAVSPQQMQAGGLFEANETFAGVDQASRIRGKTIGISRFGSGSHLIPFVIPSTSTSNAASEYKFVQLHDIAGLRNGIATGQADAFLWERFTTKKYVDSGELAVLGSVTPPWPAFLFACRTEFLESAGGEERVREFLDGVSRAINSSVYSPLAEAAGQHGVVQDGIVSEICEKFNYASADVASWFETVEFSRDCREVDASAVGRCLCALQSAGVLNAASSVEPHVFFSSATTRLV